MTLVLSSFPKSAILHIGVHKTATTHLQRSLSAQQHALINAGVRYYGPDNLRRPTKGLGDIFGLNVYRKSPHPTRSRADQTDFMFKDGQRLILSDENFIGVLHDKQGNIVSPLYPKAAARVGALASAIDVGQLDICIGLRNPASFLKSAYSQALMSGKPIGFSEYLAKNPLSQINWQGLVARIRSAVGVGHVTVWLFEDYTRQFSNICKVLMGDFVDMKIVPISNYVHRGLSGQAVASILAQPEADDPRHLAAKARATYPVGDDYPAFDPFSSVDKVSSQEEYAAQLAVIDQIDGVTILRS